MDGLNYIALRLRGRAEKDSDENNGRTDTLVRLLFNAPLSGGHRPRPVHARNDGSLVGTGGYRLAACCHRVTVGVIVVNVWRTNIHGFSNHDPGNETRIHAPQLGVQVGVRRRLIGLSRRVYIWATAS